LDIRKELSKMQMLGLRYVEGFLSPRSWDVIYLFTMFVFIILIFLTSVMCIISHGGVLYGTMRMPMWQNFLLLAEEQNIPVRDYIEQGTHWITLLTYSWAFLILLINVKRAGYHPVHMLAYTAVISVGMWVFPFEWIYTTLYDIFHNLPAEGLWAITSYGIWRWNQPLSFLSSVPGRNGITALGFVFAHIISLDNFNRWRFWCWKEIYHIDRKSLVLFLAFLGMFVFWVVMPVVVPIATDMNMVNKYNYTTKLPTWNYTETLPMDFQTGELVKGTKWFPQTTYVWYGVDPENYVDPYDIIYEEWHPNDYVKIVNIVTKTLGIVWGVYTFSPRSAKEQEEIFVKKSKVK